MQRKIIIFSVVFAILLALVGYNALKKVTPIKINNPQTNVPTELVTPTQTEVVNNIVTNDYTVTWLIVRDNKKVELIENFEEKLSSVEAKKNYNCDHLINGGFYGEDNKPLGLLVIDSVTVNNAIESKLFDSYLSIDNGDNLTISKNTPISDIRLALQSGPLLISNGKPLILNIDNDENARRMVAAKTFKNETIFLAIYSKSSPLIGPKLADLPKILDNVQKNTNLKFINAMNLDGGSHSTFYSENISLSEVARVGTFICVKP